MMHVHAKETPFTPEGPQPLLREIAPGADYPAHALGPLADVVQAVQGMAQAPSPFPVHRRWPCRGLPMWKRWAAHGRCRCTC